uniref:Uncharacterized protein n=1 Tax=Cucumis melo TaxID=3656 RepID=A0A9I9DPJ5_CUCME
QEKVGIQALSFGTNRRSWHFERKLEKSLTVVKDSSPWGVTHLERSEELDRAGGINWIGSRE